MKGKKKIKSGDGIVPQITGANYNLGKSTEVTLDDFREMMQTLARNADLKLTGEPVDYPETPDDGIRLKIKDGYLYQITGRMMMVTGADGARRCVDIRRAHGETDHEIGESIFITETQGITTDQVWFSLNDISWHAKKDKPSVG